MPVKLTPFTFGSTGSGVPLSSVVTTDIPVIDDCPVLTRLKVFVTQLGKVPTLEYTLRDRAGQPLDITDFFIAGDPSQGKLYLRAKEIVSPAGPLNIVRQVEGRCLDAYAGVVQFDLTAEMVARAGIYQLSICLANALEVSQHIESPLLWVERSLFTLDSTDTTFSSGPPNIQELRQAIMDNGGAENLLLDDVEFKDDQLAYAVSKPVMYWNEVPPPLRPALDTRNFPFREAWTNAICGHLFLIASHNYRRTHLPYNAGGIAVDDRNKEREYAAAGQQLLDDWKNFVIAKKYEINTSLFTGSIGSIYGGMFH